MKLAAEFLRLWKLFVVAHILDILPINFTFHRHHDNKKYYGMKDSLYIHFFLIGNETILLLKKKEIEQKKLHIS